MSTCLIVEDSGVIREIAARIARDMGFDVVESESAAEGVDRCRAARPDVVLLDWDLPSLGALDFLRGVGELAVEARPPIVLCATENDPQQFMLAKAAGAGRHILKPFTRAELEAIFAEVGVSKAADPAAAPRVATL
jgi:two-component system chemotaxis response regulator CheY